MSLCWSTNVLHVNWEHVTSPFQVILTGINNIIQNLINIINNGILSFIIVINFVKLSAHNVKLNHLKIVDIIDNWSFISE